MCGTKVVWSFQVSCSKAMNDIIINLTDVFTFERLIHGTSTAWDTLQELPDNKELTGSCCGTGWSNLIGNDVKIISPAIIQPTKGDVCPILEYFDMTLQKISNIIIIFKVWRGSMDLMD